MVWKRKHRVQAMSPPSQHVHRFHSWSPDIPCKAQGPITVILFTWRCLSALANFDKCNAKLSSVQPPQAVLIKEGAGRSLGYFCSEGKVITCLISSNDHICSFIFFFLNLTIRLPAVQELDQYHWLISTKMSPGGLFLICTLSRSPKH